MGAGINQGWWEWPFKDEPTATPSSTCDDVEATIAAAADTRVNVLNATDVRGLASAIGDELTLRGYVVEDVGNEGATSTSPRPSRSAYGPGLEAEAQSVALHFRGVVLVDDGRTGSVVDVVIGQGYRKMGDARGGRRRRSPPPHRAAGRVRPRTTTHHHDRLTDPTRGGTRWVSSPAPARSWVRPPACGTRSRRPSTRPSAASAARSRWCPQAQTLLTRVSVLVDRIDAVVDHAELVIGRIDEVVTESDATVERVNLVTTKADRTMAGATGLVDRADSLLSSVEPVARQGVPIATKLVESISPQEVDAAVSLLDRLPTVLRPRRGRRAAAAAPARRRRARRARDPGDRAEPAGRDRGAARGWAC